MLVWLSDCLSDCFTAIGLKPSSLFVSVFIAQDTLQILFSFMVFMRQKRDNALNVAGVGRIAGPREVDMQTGQSNTGAKWCKFQEHWKDYQRLSKIIKDCRTLQSACSACSALHHILMVHFWRHDDKGRDLTSHRGVAIIRLQLSLPSTDIPLWSVMYVCISLCYYRWSYTCWTKEIVNLQTLLDSKSILQ